ncbi:MAG: SIS domain-containing protein [Terriglobales bacterium]|jgi:glucosamine--fructose-6-phosphate aminotransferase (isomerizing)
MLHAKNTAAEPFMLREIYAQPQAILQTVQQHLQEDQIFPGELQNVEGALMSFSKLIIAASGSSRHAGLAGEIMIEDLSGIPVDVEYASEYCYRSTHAGTDPVVMLVTQSGETADTIAAQREALSRGARTIAICNVEDSTIAREAGAALLTCAGTEVAVPATKSFAAQLAVLYLFALFLARKCGRVTSEILRLHLRRLLDLPAAMSRALPEWDAQSAECAARCHAARDFLFLGRGVHCAIAREGALKLKEVSYAHAEGYPTGELLHGPQALVTDGCPLVALVTRDDDDPDSGLRYHKSLSILRQAKSRGCKLIAVASAGDREVESFADWVFFVPPACELLLPVLEVVPLQLLACHIGIRNGCDVDNPRNLVKSVKQS